MTPGLWTFPGICVLARPKSIGLQLLVGVSVLKAAFSVSGSSGGQWREVGLWAEKGAEDVRWVLLHRLTNRTLIPSQHGTKVGLFCGKTFSRPPSTITLPLCCVLLDSRSSQEGGLGKRTAWV